MRVDIKTTLMKIFLHFGEVQKFPTSIGCFHIEVLNTWVQLAKRSFHEKVSSVHHVGAWPMTAC